MDSYKHFFFRHPAHEEIAQDRYYLKDERGNIKEKDFSDVFLRVVKHLTGCEFQLEGNSVDGYKITVESLHIADSDRPAQILQVMLDKRLLGGGRILAQSGTRVANLNNCFVLDWQDNRESIVELEGKHMTIQSQGGGTGMNFSRLRPKWSWVNGNQSRSCGAVGFLSMLSWKSSLVAQGGNRSGANLGLLEDWHPDLLDFIDWKSSHQWATQLSSFSNIFDEDGFRVFEWNNPYQWQQFNVSVGLSDKFMTLLKTAPDTPWVLEWEGTPWSVWKYKAYGKEYEVTATDEQLAESKVLSQLPFFNKSQDFKLIRGDYHLTVSQWWHRIAKNAHDDGCPGVIFLDRIRAYHNGEYVNPIVATNPCGEQPLPANGVCCLGGVNIYYCLNADGSVNEVAFRDAIQAGVYMLNCVTDVTKTGIADIDANVLNERRIGLGITGWHDALIKNKLRYSSEEGRTFVAQWMRFFRDESYRASIELAKIDGPFPVFDFDGYSKSAFFKTLPKDIQRDIKQHGIRNITINTIQPFGTTGTIWGTSTGCECHYGGEYVRNSRVGSFKDGCFDYIEWIEKNGTKNIPDYFEWSHDIGWQDHLKMQNVFAQFIDSSVSKTINLPRSATIADVKRAYELAYELPAIKSTTVYVDGSKTQILQTLDGTSSPRTSIRPTRIIRHDAPKRPEVLECDIHHLVVKGTQWVVMVGMLDDQPYEVFAGKQTKVEIDKSIERGTITKVLKNKYVLQANGTRMNIREVFENAEQAALTRLISSNLRHGADIAFIVDQLQKSEDSIVEFSKAIGRVLKEYIKSATKNRISRRCPTCKGSDVKVVQQEGCEVIMCVGCGSSASKCD